MKPKLQIVLMLLCLIGATVSVKGERRAGSLPVGLGGHPRRTIGRTPHGRNAGREYGISI